MWSIFSYYFFRIFHFPFSLSLYLFKNDERNSKNKIKRKTKNICFGSHRVFSFLHSIVSIGGDNNKGKPRNCPPAYDVCPMYWIMWTLPWMLSCFDCQLESHNPVNARAIIFHRPHRHTVLPEIHSIIQPFDIHATAHMLHPSVHCTGTRTSHHMSSLPQKILCKSLKLVTHTVWCFLLRSNDEKRINFMRSKCVYNFMFSMNRKNTQWCNCVVLHVPINTSTNTKYIVVVSLRRISLFAGLWSIIQCFFKNSVKYKYVETNQ